MLLYIILISILFFIIFIIYRNNRHLNVIPMPHASVFLGHVNYFRDSKVILERMTSLTRNVDGLIRIYVPPTKPALITADRNLFKILLNSPNSINKSKDYDFLRCWLGYGVLTSEGDQWKKQRRMLLPCFSNLTMMKHFIDIFDSLGNVLIEKLNAELDNSSIDMLPLMKMYTMDVICETSMGVSMNCQRNYNMDYLKSVEHICQIAANRIRTPIKRIDSLFLFSKDRKKQQTALNVINTFFKDIMDKKMKQQKTETSSQNTLLDLLLRYEKNGVKLSHREIEDEVNTFMFAGHDTTATAMAFTLYALSRHPEVQVKVIDEQKHIFGKFEKNPVISYAHLQEMKYLEMVIKESLRLYSTVPAIGRRLTKEMDLGDGIILPKNISILCFIHGVHHDRKYFPDPEKFIPERFEDEILPYTYVPFSAGPRNCLGKKYAILQMKCCISKIMRHFKLQPSIPEYELELLPEITLASKNGIKISIEKREME